MKEFWCEKKIMTVAKAEIITALDYFVGNVGNGYRVKLHPIGAGKYYTVRHFAKNAKDLAGANW